MTSCPGRLSLYVDRDEVEDADLRAVALLLHLAGRDPDDARIPDPLWLGLARSLKAHNDGHACLRLADDDETLDLLRRIPELVAPAEERDDHPRRPFVIDGTGLYVARAHHEETVIADRLSAVAAGGRLKVLLGGPGTGKTTKVAGEIVTRLRDGSLTEDDIALAAPTGKAADRMRQALLGALDHHGAPSDIRARVASMRAVTVHRLLGYSLGRDDGRYRFRAGNHLPFSLVIVDETSMLSMSLMYRLLDALRPDASLWLVGDPDQLVSVDAGSVLGDVARATSRDLNAARTVLTTTHRYDEKSPFGRLITATRAGDVEVVSGLLDTHRGIGPELSFIDIDTDRDGLESLSSSVRSWATVVRDRASSGDASGALDALSTMQVLCATRRGTLGADSWNRNVGRWMGSGTRARWFPGRPVMVTRNDYSNDLFNGDVGVVVDVGSEGLLVAFPGPDGPRLVPPVRLGDVDTVHALTIHKSQGSEYDHAVVVLPRESRLLTRELLYTGASRARRRLTIVGSMTAVTTAVGSAVGRATGLEGRLS